MKQILASTGSEAVKALFPRRGKRGSVLLVSVVLMTIAGMAALSWAGYIVQAQHAAKRDRSRLQAFYAADAGVEQIVQYFNNPELFTGSNPATYTDLYSKQPLNYPLVHPVEPETYPLFDAYILKYVMTTTGEPRYDEKGRLMITRRTYFKDIAAGSDPEISKTSKIPTCLLDISKAPLLTFKDKNGVLLSNVKSIRLVHPIDIEAEGGTLPPNHRVITKVISTGVAPDGVEMRVESLITESAILGIDSPAAIVTKGTTEFNGNFNVHWGEIWAGGDISLPSNFLVKVPRQPTSTTTPYSPSQNVDAWFKIRTEGWIRDDKSQQYADGSDPDGTKDGFVQNPPSSSSSNYYLPYNPLSLYPVNGKHPLERLGHIEQKQTIEFHKYSYMDWKSFVLGNGFRYFFTDSTGTIYGRETSLTSTNYGKIVAKDYATWFGSSPADTDYDDLLKKVVFIDTIPTNAAGQEAPKDARDIPIINSEYFPRDPTKDPAARMATLQISGGGLHTRGAMFIAANMTGTGQGNPPSWKVVPGVLMPNFQPPPSNLSVNIFHNGLIYSWGNVNLGGNRVVYGSIFAELGFGSGGDPEVYFNEKMKDGSWLDLNLSRVNRMMWDFSTVNTTANGG